MDHGKRFQMNHTLYIPLFPTVNKQWEMEGEANNNSEMEEEKSRTLALRKQYDLLGAQISRSRTGWIHIRSQGLEIPTLTGEK